MSTLIYNGIYLSLIKTDMIERTPRMSQDQTEYMWTDFTISITSVFSPAATSYNAYGQGFGNLPAITDSYIRSALLQPRRSLLYTDGRNPIVNIPPNILIGPNTGGAIDCDNGPHPIHCNVVKISSTRLFHVSFSIKCSIVQCDYNYLPSPIVSSRYSRTEGINDQYLSTITTSGVTHFRSDVINSLGFLPDQYRSAIVPPPLFGYARKEMQFGLSTDGMTMEWTVKDVEQMRDIGNLGTPGSAGYYGITEMKLVYTTASMNKSSLGLAGLATICNVKTSAKAMKYSNTQSIIIFLLQCAWDKLINILPNAIYSACQISEDVFNNEVSLDISYVLVTGTDTEPQPAQAECQLVIQGVIGAPIASLPNLGGQNPIPPFDMGTRGTGAYQIAVSNFSTACSVQPINEDLTATNASPTNYETIIPYGNPVEVTPYPIPSPSSPPSGTTSPGLLSIGLDNQARDSLALKALYLKYELVSSWEKSQGIVALPIAMPSQSSQSQSQNNKPMPTCVNLQLFQPVMRKVIEFSIVRIGSPPQIPSPLVSQSNSDYSNYTLLSNLVSPIGVEVMPDGYTLVYRVTGVYKYSISVPLQDEALIPLDIPPWANVVISDQVRILPTDFFESQIANIDPVSA